MADELPDSIPAAIPATDPSQRPPHVQGEIDGMRAVPDTGCEPWATRLDPPHPGHVAKAAGALTAITASRKHAYMVAYTLDDAGLLAVDGELDLSALADACDDLVRAYHARDSDTVLPAVIKAVRVALGQPAEHTMDGDLNDFTAALAAADVKWAHDLGDEQSVPAYIQFLARTVWSLWIQSRLAVDADRDFYSMLLDRCGFVEDGELSAGGSADNDLAAERADAVLAFIELVKGSVLPRKLLPVDPRPTVDGDALREHAEDLWSALDWTLWGHGLGDVLRERMADTMLAALPAADLDQALQLMRVWKERRGYPMMHEQFAKLRAEVAQLTAGADATPAEPGVQLSPGQWIARWNAASAEHRREWARSVIEAGNDARNCLMRDHEGELAYLRSLPKGDLASCPAIPADAVIVTRAQLVAGMIVGLGDRHDPVPPQYILDRAADLIMRQAGRTTKRLLNATEDDRADVNTTAFHCGAMHAEFGACFLDPSGTEHEHGHESEIGRWPVVPAVQEGGNHG